MKQEPSNDELYKLYAQFLIKFEYVSHLMRVGITFILFPDHEERRKRHSEILLEGLTADQIRKKFMAFVAEDFKPDTEIFKLTKSISDAYEKAIPLRNSFAHGTTYIGENPLVKDSKDGQIILRHPKLKKEGLDLNFKKIDTDALKLGIELFEKLTFAVHVVTVVALDKLQKYEDSARYKPNKILKLTLSDLERLRKKLIILLK